jgi:hypothetical protein
LRHSINRAHFIREVWNNANPFIIMIVIIHMKNLSWSMRGSQERILAWQPTALYKHTHRVYSAASTDWLTHHLVCDIFRPHDDLHKWLLYGNYMALLKCLGLLFDKLLMPVKFNT